MKTFAIGDIHGAHKALVQCLERSGFNYAKDILIVLGDVVDGWSETPFCIEELLKIRNMIYIWGNHDWWANKWLQSGWTHPVWESQGGDATKESYIQNGDLLVKHRDFFKVARFYHIDDNRLFVHGGIPPRLIQKSIRDQEPNDLMWDRELYLKARWKHYRNPDFKYGDYSEIFLGHTSTVNVGDREPFKYCNIWNLDQGGGWEGKLSIMDVDTHEYWQSDIVGHIYKGIRGRS